MLTIKIFRCKRKITFISCNWTKIVKDAPMRSLISICSIYLTPVFSSVLGLRGFCSSKVSGVDLSAVTWACLHAPKTFILIQSSTLFHWDLAHFFSHFQFQVISISACFLCHSSPGLEYISHLNKCHNFLVIFLLPFFAIHWFIHQSGC